MYETITTPLSTATPKRAMKPTAAEMLKGMPRSKRRNTPPTAASGIPVNTRSAWRTELNVEKSRMKIRKRLSGTTIRRRVPARSRFSNWPPHSKRLPVGGVDLLSLEDRAHGVDEGGDVASAHVALDDDQAGAVHVADLAPPSTFSIRASDASGTRSPPGALTRRRPSLSRRAAAPRGSAARAGSAAGPPGSAWPRCPPSVSTTLITSAALMP